MSVIVYSFRWVALVKGFYHGEGQSLEHIAESLPTIVKTVEAKKT